MENLSVTTVQAHLYWEDVNANLQSLSDQLSTLNEPTDLIILPEMFSTGFTMDASKVAEPINGKTMDWMRLQANHHQAVVTGSLIIKENGQYFNRLIWMHPTGDFEYYDKRHLFTLAKEHETYQMGKQKLITELKGWKICPLICYDLRFPVWSRNVEGFDLLIYVANWPITRSAHWRTLLLARAMENQCFTIGVNRVGEDEKGLKYSGDTSLIDYSGQLIYQISHVPQVVTTTLEYDGLAHYRKKLNFLPDQDQFSVLP